MGSIWEPQGEKGVGVEESMPYRALDEALEQRRRHLERVVEESEEHRRRLEEAEAAAREARAELAAVAEHIRRRRRRLPIVSQLRVAAPCPMKWDDLSGDGHVRFCGRCMKNVYDLWSMSTREIAALLEETDGDLCGRLRRRADGTVITGDCPRGVRGRRRRLASAAAAAITLTGASLASLYEPSLGRLDVNEDARTPPRTHARYPDEPPEDGARTVLGKLCDEPQPADELFPVEELDARRSPMWRDPQPARRFPTKASLEETRHESPGGLEVSDETLLYMKRALRGGEPRGAGAPSGAAPIRREHR